MTSVEAIAAVPFIDGIVYGEWPRWHGDRLWFTDGLAGRVYSAGAAGDLAVEVELARASGLGWLPDGWAVAPALGGPDGRTLYLVVDETSHEDLLAGKSTGRILQARVDVPGLGSP